MNVGLMRVVKCSLVRRSFYCYSKWLSQAGFLHGQHHAHRACLLQPRPACLLQPPQQHEAHLGILGAGWHRTEKDAALQQARRWGMKRWIRVQATIQVERWELQRVVCIRQAGQQARADLGNVDVHLQDTQQWSTRWNMEHGGFGCGATDPASMQKYILGSQ